MGWIIFLSILAVVLAAVGFILDKYTYGDVAEFFEGACWTISITALAFVIVLPFTLINKQADFDKIKYEYENVKRNVEVYDASNYGNAVPVMEDISELNKQIARHKAHANSWWDSAWFSEEVGNLEPLVLDTRKKAE